MTSGNQDDVVGADVLGEFVADLLVSLVVRPISHERRLNLYAGFLPERRAVTDVWRDDPKPSDGRVYHHVSSFLLQRLLNLRHGNRAFANDLPGAAMDVDDGRAHRCASFSAIQDQGEAAAELLHQL